MNWRSVSWRFLQFNTKFHIHSLFDRVLHFHVFDKVDETERSNELLFDEYRS
jgi:hypothetical protein